MGKLWLGSVSALFVVWLVSCGGDPSHPPNLKSGGDGGTGNVSGGGSGGGTGGVACDPDPTLGSEISGNLIVYNTLLSTKQPYSGPGHLVMEGTPCGWAIGEYDGSTFLIQGVKASGQNWIHTYQDDNGTEDVLTTLQAVSTFSDLTLTDEFAFVRASDVDAMYAAVGLTRDPTKGTVLAKIVDVVGLTQVPKSGVVISSGGDAQIAYALGSDWVLGTGQTDGNGIAALLNAESEDFPGKSTTLYVDDGTVDDTFPTPVQTNAVSIQVVTLGF